MEQNTYKSGKSLAKTLRLFLLLSAIFNGSFVLIRIIEYFLFDLSLSETKKDPSYLIFTLFLGLFSLGVILVSYSTPVIFLIWQYRAAKNLKSINESAISNSPAWNVGWWFIPFASLAMPFVCINELLNGSVPKNALDGNYVSDSSSNATTQLWWGLYLLSGFIGILTAYLSFKIIKQPEFMQYFLISIIFSHSFNVIAALVVRGIVLTIDNDQEESYRLFCEKRNILNPPEPPNFN